MGVGAAVVKLIENGVESNGMKVTRQDMFLESKVMILFNQNVRFLQKFYKANIKYMIKLRTTNTNEFFRLCQDCCCLVIKRIFATQSRKA